MASKIGFGSKLEYDSGGAVFVEVAYVTKIRPFALKADVIDVSSMQSTSQFREKISGMMDSGQVQADLNYDDKATSHLWLKTNLGVVGNFRITGPGSSPKVLTFSAFISSVGPEYPFDNKLTCSITLDISGVVTVT